MKPTLCVSDGYYTALMLFVWSLATWLLVYEIVKHRKSPRQRTWSSNMKDENRKLIEEMDAFARSSCDPETFESWCTLVRHWDKHLPELKDIRKDYHSTQTTEGEYRRDTREAIALLNSMVLSGENHSDSSIEIVKKALSRLSHAPKINAR